MNGFIVWDKVARCFAQNICLEADLLQDGISYSLEVKEDLYELFFAIGLTDVDGKKIYAESSIVEFDFKGNMIRGVFRYHKRSLSYKIQILENTEFILNMMLLGFISLQGDEIEDALLQYNSDFAKHLKIIDTIQENKQGLIK